VIPAAGIGSRMQADRPKQYLQLHGRTVLEHSLQRLAAPDYVKGVMLVLAPHDPWWPELAIDLDKPLYFASGGIERCYSVLNALQDLGQYAEDDDWVLVHDAARPCVRRADLDALVAAVQDDEVGGLLATPVRDTMKRAEPNHRVITTENREGLWHALTPQMFRLGMLRHALEQAFEDEQLVTDEASALELAGYQPLLVEGHSDNLKITRAGDLALAEFYLQQQESA
jgi:2-C-methyl-D-erythritol 4-phosphate cytidylyltransferase